jgi:hypothetical protein
MGFFEAAKKFVTDPENIARARALATEQNVDLAAGKLRQLAPEQIRGAVDGLAAKAKEWGGAEDEKPAAVTDGAPEAEPEETPAEQPDAKPEEASAAAPDAEPDTVSDTVSDSEPEAGPGAEPADDEPAGEGTAHQGEAESRA